MKATRQPQARKVRVRQRGQQRDDAGRQAQTDGKADLRQAGVESLVLLAGIFISHQHGAAPFAAETDTLQDAKQNEQHGRRHADLRIGRQQADQHGGDAHDQQRGHQHALAADTIAEMAEDQAAERACEEADGECRIGQQRGDERIVGGKIELVEDKARDCAIEEEIIPFDRRPDDRGGDDASDVVP